MFLTNLKRLIYFAAFYFVWFVLAAKGAKHPNSSLLLFLAILFAIVFHRSTFVLSIALGLAGSFVDNLMVSLLGLKYAGGEDILPPFWLIGMWIVFIPFLFEYKLFKLHPILTALIFSAGGLVAGSALKSFGTLTAPSLLAVSVLWGIYGFVFCLIYTIWKRLQR